MLFKGIDTSKVGKRRYFRQKEGRMGQSGLMGQVGAMSLVKIAEQHW